MHYLEGERLENKQIKRSLQKIGFSLARIFLQISWRNDISSLVDGQGRILITHILSSLPQWGSRIESKPITLRANLELPTNAYPVESQMFASQHRSLPAEVGF
jgi:hypothetical protein